jgi:hypothetical protein
VVRQAGGTIHLVLARFFIMVKDLLQRFEDNLALLRKDLFHIAEFATPMG